MKKIIERKEDLKINNTFLMILKASAISIGITLILLLIYSIVLTYTNIKENTMSPIIITITGISILIGSSYGIRKIKKMGIINGGLIGFTYIFTIYLLSSITQTGFGFNIYSILVMAVSIILGMLGGVIGVNMGV